MNKIEIEERGLKPILDIIDKLGGWPVVKGDQWNVKSEWSWTGAVEKLRKLGYSVNYVFELSVESDFKNSTTWIINVSSATSSFNLRRS